MLNFVYTHKLVSDHHCLELCERFCSQQIFIKIVYLNGTQEFYDFLNQKMANWGREFLVLSFRVIYFLEKRSLEDEYYKGFKMFDIYDKVFQNDLEQFLQARNPNLLILYKSKLGKDQNVVKNLTEIKIQESENLKTIQAISCLSGLSSSFEQAKILEELGLPAGIENLTFDHVKSKFANERNAYVRSLEYLILL